MNRTEAFYRELSQVERDQLEALVDAASLSDVVEALGRIAAEKAEHIRTTWQDTYTARPWQKASDRLDRIVPHVRV